METSGAKVGIFQWIISSWTIQIRFVDGDRKNGYTIEVNKEPKNSMNHDK
jgi:hypothetical protein